MNPIFQQFLIKKLLGNKDKPVILMPGASPQDMLKYYVASKAVEKFFGNEEVDSNKSIANIAPLQKPEDLYDPETLSKLRRRFTQPRTVLNFILLYAWLFLIAPLTDPILPVSGRIFIYLLGFIYCFWFLFKAIRLNMGYKEFKFAKSWISYLLFYIPHGFFAMGAIYYFLTY